MEKTIPEVVTRLTTKEIRDVAEYYYSDGLVFNYDQEGIEMELGVRWAKEEWVKIKELAWDYYRGDWTGVADTVRYAAEELGFPTESEDEDEEDDETEIAG